MEATLKEILDSREWRAEKQQALLNRFQKPLLCFTMNIPGPEKWNRDVSIGFAVGNLLLRKRLQNVVHRESRISNAGCAAFYVVDMPAGQLKQIAMEMEQIGPVGRLFDMDVLEETGRKLSREEMGQEPRKCLLCGEDARICGRTRAHGLAALHHKTKEILAIAARWLFDYIADAACTSLIQEVNTTPKPGLVDKNNRGSHEDMSVEHFLASAEALRPHFCRFTEMGYLTRDMDPREALARIRPIGREAEQAMLGATGGVNTHKGAIFSMGLLCAAAGRISPHEWQAETLLRTCAEMTRGIVAEDFEGITEANARTAGERLFVKYGITGVRGQAEAGFPAVKDVGLPVFRAAIRKGCSENRAGCITLLHLMANTDDTNLIHRGSRKRQLEIRQEIGELLRQDPYPEVETIEELDSAFIQENLSPGGSADLLAMTYFLAEVEEIV